MLIFEIFGRFVMECPTCHSYHVLSIVRLYVLARTACSSFHHLSHWRTKVRRRKATLNSSAVFFNLVRVTAKVSLSPFQIPVAADEPFTRPLRVSRLSWLSWLAVALWPPISRCITGEMRHLVSGEVPQGQQPDIAAVSGAPDDRQRERHGRNEDRKMTAANPAYHHILFDVVFMYMYECVMYVAYSSGSAYRKRRISLKWCRFSSFCKKINDNCGWHDIYYGWASSADQYRRRRI